MRIDLNRPETLVVLKQDCMSRVTDAIATALRTYIPDIPGQEEIYRLKYLEATQLEFTGNSAGPMLTDYANTAGITVKEAAENVISKYRAWRAAIESAESLRLAHKAKIAELSDEDMILKITADTAAACNRLCTS